MAKFCFEDLAAATEGLLSKKEVKDLEGRLSERARQLRTLKNKTQANALNEALQEELDAEERLKLQRKRANLMSMEAGQKVLINAQRFKGDPVSGLMSQVSPIQSNIKEARYSADGMQAGRRHQSYHNFTVDLEKNKVLDYFNSMPNPRLVAEELFEEGTVKDENVRTLASIIKKHFETSRKLLNRFGANIASISDYIARQTHNPEKLRNPWSFKERKLLQIRLFRELKDPKLVSAELNRLAFEKWRNFVQPRLNIEKTFKGIPPSEVEGRLKDIWTNIVSGEHSVFTSDDLGDIKISRPFSGVSRMEGRRILNFKDGGSWFEYQDEYGVRNLHDQILSQLWHAGGQVGLMEKFGPRPRAVFESVKNKLIVQNKDIPKLRAKMNKNPTWAMDVVEGKSAGVPDNLLGKILKGLISIRGMNIGSVWLSSLPDIGLFEAKARQFGGKIFSGEYEAIKNLTNFTEEQKILGEQLGFLSDSTMGAALGRFGSLDSPFSSFSRMAGLVHKLNFMQHHDFSLRVGWSAFLASHLGTQADLVFDALPESTRQSLNIHGVGEKEWDLMRDRGNRLKSIKNKYLMTPEMARTYTKKSVAKFLGKSVDDLTPSEFEDTKSDIQAKWLSYFIDESSDVIPQPSAATLGLIYRGTRGDEVKGLMLRMMFQFKSWNAEVTRRTFGRYLYGGGAESLYDAFRNGKADIPGLVEFMLQQTKWGYISVAAGALARGQEPPDPRNPSIFLQAAEAGGGLTIYGGLLEQLAQKYLGKGAFDPLTPPVGGIFRDTTLLLKSLLDHRRNKETHSLFYAVKLAQHNIPILNFFYAKTALNHLFLFGLMEKSKPGYLDHLQSLARKEGNKYWINPTEDTNLFR